MQGNGYAQGYFIGLFSRFIWYFSIYFILQSILMYIFGINFFTYWVLAIIFSFFINTSLPIRESYPFVRHGIIYFCLIFAQSYSSNIVINFANSFFNPNWLWILFVGLSFLFGVIASFGKYSHGSARATIEGIGNLGIIIISVLAFIFFWWKGGVVYLVLRLPLMFLEIAISNLILSMLIRSYESKDISIED